MTGTKRLSMSFRHSPGGLRPLHGHDQGRPEGAVLTARRSRVGVSGRLFGAALNTQYLGSEAIYTELAGTEFSYVTAEWEMKWMATEPSRGSLSLGGGDALSDFSVAHGMQLKGHTLVWYSEGA